MPMQKKMKLLALRRQCRPAGLAYEAVPILLTGGGLHRSGVLLLSSSKLCFNVFIQAISILPLQVRYYSVTLPTQHGYCVVV